MTDRRENRRRVGSAACAVVLALALLAPVVSADDPVQLGVKWGPDYRTMSFRFLGQLCEYARDIARGAFPAAGREPEFRFDKNWPVIAMTAQWTASVEGWPEKYRPEAIDLILMHACDAQAYENIYPDVIQSSRFTFPPEFLKEAADPTYRLAETMRGKEVGYEVTARGGFGAKDYKIKTRIRIGLSEDGKTVFYHDKPDYISANLTAREYLFAAHDAGDRIQFEARLLCQCAPRRTFQGEAMRRVEADSMYFVRRIYEDLDDAPTLAEIEKQLDMIRKGDQPTTVLKGSEGN
ncbi:MAG: hypothetical protein AB1696_26800 [Planctomycetota bacterium]